MNRLDPRRDDHRPGANPWWKQRLFSGFASIGPVRAAKKGPTKKERNREKREARKEAGFFGKPLKQWTAFQRQQEQSQ